MILGFFIGPRLFAKLRSLKAKQSLRTKEQVGAIWSQLTGDET